MACANQTSLYFAPVPGWVLRSSLGALSDMKPKQIGQVTLGDLLEASRKIAELASKAAKRRIAK